MDIYHLIQAIILGLLQGLSEFLPISSSGHLTLFPWMFGWETPGLVFDTSLHLGTSLALLAYFWRDFINIAKVFLPLKQNNQTPTDTATVSQNRTLGFAIILGMLPAGIIGLLFDKHIERFFQDPLGTTQIMMIVTSLIFFGVTLWASDRFFTKTKELQALTWKHALAIGSAQILALFPGTSRSGITMTAGMTLGFTRETAARFSFLVGAPITFAAGLFKLKDLRDIALTPDVLLYFILGFLASAFSGYLCIRFFLTFLKKYPVTVFTLYRIIFGLVVLCVLFARL